MERTVRKSGAELTYIPVSEVINRMNRIFGPGGWSHQVLSCERDAIDPDWVIAHVAVTADLDGQWMRHSGYGGAKIKRNKQGDIVDLGDEFKGAVSDALKKACQHLGIGLYLARDIDAIEVDEAMHAPVEERVDNELDTMYSRFMDIRSGLNEQQLQQLREYWNTYSGGRPVPKRSEFTAKELELLTVEALRLLVNGETVASPENLEQQ